MENSIEAYIDYFKALAESHRDIRDFVYGDSERILNRERSTIKYPILWLEVPDYSRSKYDEEGGILHGALVVLSNFNPNNPGHKHEQEEHTFGIAKQIATRINQESNDGTIRLLGSNLKIEPVSPWSADKDLGWRIDFKIGVSAGCLDADITGGVWSDL